ncbi:SLC13 family permease [Pararhodobacter sp. SW119]|uniref:SLC13 family permease n=1 Tax=Pararhodobacter sp. SW119 TaxID=2780075 RepID=UPI001ADF21F0|nr:SLC13 family permease [Pararhodobacter sp. SW119]
MSVEQSLILSILALTMALFLWGRLRHDVVALAALLACVVVGLVPPEDAFNGFGHPAVITVACVLVLSRGLQNTGAVDLLTRTVLPQSGGRIVSMTALLALGTGLSAFMNNVGAMALLMPVAVQLAGRLDLAPGQVLMPLAFGTILGGMTTLVGTPPNLIVSGFRPGAGFAMFDFAPVGLAVAITGIVAIVLVGWRLVPARKPSGDDGFQTAAYFTEVRVGEKSDVAGKTLRKVEEALDDTDAQIVALVRNEVRMSAPRGNRVVRAGDILVLEAHVDGLAEALAKLDLQLEEQGTSDEKEEEELDEEMMEKVRPRQPASTEKDEDKDEEEDTDKAKADDIVLRELVVLPGSILSGRSAKDIKLRTRYGLNLLAVSREGRRPHARLRTLAIRSGDVLLMQGPAETLGEFAGEMGCVPLADRALRLPERRMALTAAGIMLGAVAIATAGLLPAAPAFALGVLASMLLRTVPPRQIYTAIDWPVIVLLAALIPVAGAMEATGTADLLAGSILYALMGGAPALAVVAIMVLSLLISNVVNNAATAAAMSPIAVGMAQALGLNPDAFLMAVAIGASAAFLTPIGHQNNTLILGPGGFRFADYWRLGLPASVLTVAVSVPVLLLVWPLDG